jgi:hypothetical protein
MPRMSLPVASEAQVVNDALDWLRNNNLKQEDLDDPTVQALSNLAGLPVPSGRLPPGTKKKAADDALNWLRNNSPRSDDVDEPTLQALANMAGLPMPPSSIPPQELIFVWNAEASFDLGIQTSSGTCKISRDNRVLQKNGEQQTSGGR